MTGALILTRAVSSQRLSDAEIEILIAQRRADEKEAIEHHVREVTERRVLEEACFRTTDAHDAGVRGAALLVFFPVMPQECPAYLPLRVWKAMERYNRARENVAHESLRNILRRFDFRSGLREPGTWHHAGDPHHWDDLFVFEDPENLWRIFRRDSYVRVNIERGTMSAALSWF